MDYRKESYKLIFVWIIGFVIFLLAGNWVVNNLFNNISSSNNIRIQMILINIGILALFYIIYVTENIYWYNGISYEEAKKLGSEKRRLYAKRHLILFFKAFIIIVLCFLLSSFLGMPIVIDILIFLIVIIASAIKSMSIKV